MLESAYESCLCHELTLRGVEFERQRALPLTYKDALVDAGYRLDIVVEDLVIVEIKAVEGLLLIHQAQLLTYLKLSGISLGLLVNFNVQRLQQGLKRVVHNFGVSTQR